MEFYLVFESLLLVLGGISIMFMGIISILESKSTIKPETAEKYYLGALFVLLVVTIFCGAAILMTVPIH